MKLTRKINFFFSVRERAVFYKSCNLNGIASGQYSSIRFAHSGRYPIRGVLSRLVRLMRLVAFTRQCFGHDNYPIND